MVLSVTFVPAAVALFIGERVAESENRLMAGARRFMRRCWWTLANTPVVLAFAGAAVLLAGLTATRLGSEFIPSLDEGDFAVQALRIPGTSLSQSIAMQQQIETRLKAKFPEIERVFARTGTAEIASDPMPPNASDGYVMLRPRAQWPDPSKPRALLLEQMQAELETLPGNRLSSRSRSSCVSTS